MSVTSVESVNGFNGLTDRTGSTDKTRMALIDGPGRVCRFLMIDRTLNRSDLTMGERLWVEDRGERIPASTIAAYPRIGVDYAGKWATKPWRFRLKGADG